MSELSTATKHWKAKYDRANRVGVALSLVTLLLAFFNVMQALAATPPLPPPAEKPVFDFNGQRCTTLRQEPEFIYRVDKQTVTLTIECAPELMLHYFEATPEIAL
tara:strand:- start:172 stop:486 length:315 start_codon:yes stop_codon:yes gene_type:complete